MIIKTNIYFTLSEKLIGKQVQAIAFFPFILLSKRANPEDTTLLTHERIHLRQQIELLIIPFYFIYLIEYLFKGYQNISFEREAYTHHHDVEYLKKRKWFGFMNYL